ncbi:HMG1/2-like protein isoform X1 [Mercurialis annua]|uniref:HMG1/2-like protein isoform X1 n=1 Tax=Mercurialis annua TaxID=3986 RepID=UPI00215EFFC7|nr:HMG1/2-like protein isoform X1 [Mercurialis annua]XP_055962255.1 HMG1/2-like protein isoform X1 [Mercurialis annua]
MEDMIWFGVLRLTVGLYLGQRGIYVLLFLCQNLNEAAYIHLQKKSEKERGEEVGKYFKEKFPDNKAVAAVGKAGGKKWKSLTGVEKALYAEKTLKRKLSIRSKYNQKEHIIVVK